MVTVTNTPSPVNLGDGLSMAFAPIMWMIDHFFAIAFLCIIFVVIIFVFIMYYMNNEEKKEQEDMLYKEFKNTIRTIKKNQDPRMYTSKYSLWNLIFLGIPIFNYKVGRKIYDKRNRFVGFYDGMFTDMLGNTNILLWKDKTLGIIKNDFVLRIPSKAYMIKTEEDIKAEKGKKTGIKNKIGDETFYIQWVTLDKNLVLFSEADKTISIKMLNYVKNDYYYYPLFEDDKGNILDLTESINVINNINSSNNLLTQVIKESGKNVIGMAKTNTQLVYDQRQPEKVKDIDND